MKNRTSADPHHLVFLHISKTGGTTLGVPLRLMYGYRHSLQVGNENDLESFLQLPPEKQRDIRLLKGHGVPFGVHNRVSGTVRYVTLVREPVPRIDSFHRMLLEEYTRSQFSIESLETYVENGHRTYTPNAQLRAIVGLDSTDEPVTQRTFERAKDILDEHFVVAGITKRFDASILLMKDRLGWPWPPFYVRSRTGSRTLKTPVPDDLARRIREQNQWDVHLHEYVSNRLNASVEKKGDSFQRRLRRFKKMNRAFEAVAQYPIRAFRSLREWGKERDIYPSLLK